MSERIVFDPTDSEPLYRQLANHLREKIILGEIHPGEKLPSENDMLESYNVGRLTIRNALALLVQEGMLTKVQGKGTFCTGGSLNRPALDIEVLLDMSDTYFIPYYVHGISEVLSQSNSNFLIHDTKDNDEVLCSLLESISLRGSSGIILQYTGVLSESRHIERLNRYFDLLSARGLPIIVVDGKVDNSNLSSFTVDEEGGGRRAAEHLAAFSHKRCAVVTLVRHRDSRLRYEGFLEGARIYHMDEPIEICTEGQWEAELLRSVRHGVTGIFAYNDSAAIRCMMALHREGYRIPQDVSIIGFDDTYLSTSCDPLLTTLAHPKEKIGRDAARKLLEMIRTGRFTAENRIYPVTLTIRDSCGIASRRASY